MSLASDNGLLQQYARLPFVVFSLDIQKRKPWSALGALVTLIRILDREDVSLVHAHMFHSLIAGLVCRAVRPKVKVVFTSHTSSGFSWLRRLTIGATKRFRAADVVFQPGQHVELNAASTHVIPNGVAVDRFAFIPLRAKRDSRVFLFVGRLEPAKDPVALIDAFAQMRHQTSQLWLAGEGALLQEIEARIVAKGLQDRVRLLGMRSDVPRLLREVDCFVMCSRWEGMPIALLEAGAVALPVIATPVGAIPDIIGEGCGFLARVEDLPQTMDLVVADYGAAQARGQNLRNRILERYSLETMVRKHADLYGSL